MSAVPNSEVIVLDDTLGAAFIGHTIATVYALSNIRVFTLYIPLSLQTLWHHHAPNLHVLPV